MTDMVPLNDLAQEANDNHEQVISNAKKAISAAMAAGAALLRAKEQVAHGEWGAWQKQNLNYSQPTAFRYMTIASNYSSMNNLKDAKDINDALRMISERKAEENPEHVPRSERKTGRVTVETALVMSTDEDPHAHHEADENAVPAEPTTNTLHRPETRRARESDRPAPAVVTPEIVDEPSPDWSVLIRKDDHVAVVAACREILATHWMLLLLPVLENVPVGDKKAAKVIRNAADRVDPPAIGAPSIEAVEAWATENRLPDFDANKFFNHYELAGWKYGKAKTPIKDWKRAAANAYAGGNGWAVDGANRLPF